jgi:coenzyme F420-reducing hydrogenase gamma subunit
MVSKAKPKVAIFDFTDCEGCEVSLVSLREKLLELAGQVEIVNWRLAQKRADDGPYDVVLIEGTPVTQDEINALNSLRYQAEFLIGLGSCATLGGIPGIIDKKARSFWYKKIYGPEYTPRGIDALPLTAYVKVDYLIHGCPVEKKEIVRLMEELLAGKAPKARSYSVCFECKLAGNRCRFLEKKICLGPITSGGCGAICVSGGSPCYGCFGLREDAQVDNLLEALYKFSDSGDVEKYFSMFLKKTPEYKRIFENSKEKNAKT